MRRIAIVVLAVAGLGVASQAQAQWDAPSFLPPRPGEDLGVYISDQGDFAIEGIWRQQGSLNLGLRAGYVDAANGLFLVGAETWSPIFTASREFPLDISWALGVGGLFGDVNQFEVPAGITLGHTFVLAPTTIQVYGYPRLGLFITSNGDANDAELDGLFDIGADAQVGDNLKLRLGITFGRSDALGVGLAWGVGRGVEVR